MRILSAALLALGFVLMPVGAAYAGHPGPWLCPSPDDFRDCRPGRVSVLCQLETDCKVGFATG